MPLAPIPHLCRKPIKIRSIYGGVVVLLEHVTSEGGGNNIIVFTVRGFLLTLKRICYKLIVIPHSCGLHIYRHLHCRFRFGLRLIVHAIFSSVLEAKASASTSSLLPKCHQKQSPNRPATSQINLLLGLHWS